VAVPIERAKLRDRVLSDLEALLSDNTNAWILQPSGTYERVHAGLAEPYSSQQAMLSRYAEI